MRRYEFKEIVFVSRRKQKIKIQSIEKNLNYFFCLIRSSHDRLTSSHFDIFIDSERLRTSQNVSDSPGGAHWAAG